MAESVNCDILVVGGGPAGLAATLTARRAGKRVVLVDDNPSLGGQIWRGQEAHPSDGAASWWITCVRRSGAQVATGTRIVDVPSAGLAVGERDGRRVEFRYQRAILCGGARELFLPFPGWTLPGVAGAGGLQALVKAGLPIAGKRVAVAGSGPLLWAVADALRAKGAEVVLLAEQASLGQLLPVARLMLADPDKLLQGAGYRLRLLATPVEFGAWPARANGKDKLESVTFRTSGGERTVACDYLACAFGLVPNLDLPALFGVGTRADGVRTGLWQDTNVPGVYVAGEACGVAGVDKAVIEGRIAAHAACGREARARALFHERQLAAQAGQALLRAFALRPELRALADDHTLLCRCEDVTVGRARACRHAREAKMHTRLGMGPCQGRVCGPAACHLFGWPADTLRPPAAPVPLDVLSAH